MKKTKLDLTLENFNPENITKQKVFKTRSNPKVEVKYIQETSKKQEKTENKISLDELNKMLESHDWTGIFSDDYRVATKCTYEFEKIKKAAQELGDQGVELLSKYLNKIK